MSNQSRPNNRQGNKSSFSPYKQRRKKRCPFKSEKIDVLDYKDVGLLSKFISDRGKSCYVLFGKIKKI